MRRYKGGYRGPGYRLLKWYGGAAHPRLVAWILLRPFTIRHIKKEQRP